jgi:hypothetical protein
MIKPVVNPTDLHARLMGQGHAPSPDARESAIFTQVWPPPEMIVTVALEMDTTLLPTYRQRYFTCVLDQDENPVIQYKSEFALSGVFAAIAGNEPATGPFMAGPLLWLLRRLRPFTELLVWPDENAWASGGGCLLEPEHFADLPQLQPWARGGVDQFSGLPDAILLDLKEASDCRVLWRLANLVAWSSSNFFVSDALCREVYLLHHHDKVVISIPAGETRRALSQELAKSLDVLRDYSGYTTSADGELQQWAEGKPEK